MQTVWKASLLADGGVGYAGVVAYVTTSRFASIHKRSGDVWD